MMTRHPEAYQYLRLTWSPEVGDLVYFENKKRCVKKVVKGRGLLLEGSDNWYYAGQLTWRPTPHDFNKILLKLSNLWVYRQPITDKSLRQQAAIKLNNRTVPLKGYPHQLLSQVLSLRTVDSSLSIHINRVFEQAYRPIEGWELNNEQYTLSTKGGNIT